MHEHDHSIAARAQSSHRFPSSFPAMSASTVCVSPEKRRRRRRVSLVTGMAILVTIGCVTICRAPAIAQSTNAAAVGMPLTGFVAEASLRFGIPAAWIRAVMQAESFGDVRAISPRGAMGLMQIMPETWAALRRRYGLGADPYDAHDNILAGAAYLHELHDRYGIPGFLAAYNAGPARWEDHIATGRPLPAETRAYLARLAPVVGDGAADDTVLLAAVVRSWTEASLFPARTADLPSSNQPASNTSSPSQLAGRPMQDWTGLAPQSDGLFVALSSKEGSQ
jgi:hypothetical protein